MRVSHHHRPSTRSRRAAAGRLVRQGAVVMAIGAVMAVTGGCATSAPPSTGPTGKVHVVATTTQVADLTRNIMSDDTRLDTLLKPQQSPHHFDPTAADLTALAHADVLVVSGAGLEPWIVDAADASGFHGSVINASQGVTAAEATSASASADSGDDREASTRAAHDALERAEEPAGDPHVWTDPNNAETMVHTIADGLTASFPDGAAQVAQRSASYAGKLATLDGWIHENIDIVPRQQRLVVSDHDALAAYLDRYGITFVGSILPGFEDNAEPSVTQTQQLVSKIKTLGVTAIFAETSISPKTARAIAASAGVEVYSGSDALYGDSLGAPDTPGATYIDATVHNTKMFLQSWGIVPKPLPAGLRS